MGRYTFPQETGHELDVALVAEVGGYQEWCPALMTVPVCLLEMSVESGKYSQVLAECRN